MLNRKILSSKQQQQLYQPKDASAVLLSDISKIRGKFLSNRQPLITDSSNWAVNYYPEIEAFSLIYSNQLIIYFLKTNNVLPLCTHSPHFQIVREELSTQIELCNSQNVFLVKIAPEVGVGGHLLVAFGTINYALLHINPQYQDQGECKFLGIKSLQNLRGQTPNDYITTVKLHFLQTLTQGKNYQPISELQFTIGSGDQQRVIMLKIQMKKDIENETNSLLVFRSEDQLLHEAQTTFTYRLSNFFTSKLGYQSEQVSSHCVRDILLVDNLRVIVTNKEFILVNALDREKIQQVQFLDDIQQREMEDEVEIRDPALRNLISLKYLTCSALKTNGSLILTFFAMKHQMVHQNTSYEDMEEAQLMTFFYTIPFGKIQDPAIWKTDVVYTDVSDKMISEVIKSAAFTFICQEDLRSIIAVDSVYEGTLIIEVSHSLKISNFKQLKEHRMLGCSVFPQSQEEVLATIVTSNDVLTYFINPQDYLDLTKSQPLSFRENVRPDQALEPVIPKAMVSPQVSVKGNLRMTLFDLLDIYSQQPSIGIEQSLTVQKQLDTIQAQVENIVASSSPSQIHAEINAILIESLDQQMSDNQFTRYGSQDTIDPHFQNDDGLVLSAIETKEQKLQVIKKFLQEFSLLQMTQDEGFMGVIDDCLLKVKSAKVIREFQEQLKKENFNFKSVSLSKKELKPETQLLQIVIDRTAEKYGHDFNTLKQKGTTSINVVFGKITNFEHFLITLMETCLSQNSQVIAKITPNQDPNEVIKVGSKILGLVVQKITNEVKEAGLDCQRSFLVTSRFLDGMFCMIQAISEGIGSSAQNEPLKALLTDMSHLFLELMRAIGVSSHERYEEWRNNIVLFIERKIGISQAIQFSEQYQARELLCRLVYEGGKIYYPVLVRYISSQDPTFIEQAMNIIYAQDKAKVKNSILSKQNVQELQTVDKQRYSGFQMFDIFEESFLQQLIEFCNFHNKRLLSMLMLRTKHTNEAHMLLKEILPKTKFVDTQRTLASLGEVNSQIFQQKESWQYFHAKSAIAEIQKKCIEPSSVQLLQVNENFLDQAMKNDQSRGIDLQNAFIKQFNILEMAFITQEESTELEQFKNLVTHVWMQLVMQDEQNIKGVQQMLPGANETDVFTEYEIIERAKQSLMYQLVSKLGNQPKPYKLTQDVRGTLVNMFPELQRGLSLIWTIADRSDISGLLFSQHSQSINSLLYPEASQQESSFSRLSYQDQ